MVRSNRSPDEAALAALVPLVLQSLSGATGGATLGESYSIAKNKLREAVRNDPIDANLTFLAGATAAFYFAEKDVNPKVRTFMDALVYVTTCLNVGYADVLARTETGKLIGSIVMTVGPSLVGSLLDRPVNQPSPELQAQQAMIAKMDEILAELKRQRNPQGG